MGLKTSDTATDPLVTRWTGGLDWIAYPDEGMQRASHAIATNGQVWLIDPVDFGGLDEEISDLGEISGVVILFDRHERDALLIADRHDVPVYVPEWMTDVTGGYIGETVRFEGELASTGYRLQRVLDHRFWQEGMLVSADGTLVVPETLGTAAYFRGGDERLGVHPLLRLFPPRRAFRNVSPERILVGHGRSIFEDSARSLRDALSYARRHAPSAYARALRSVLP